MHLPNIVKKVLINYDEEQDYYTVALKRTKKPEQHNNRVMVHKIFLLLLIFQTLRSFNLRVLHNIFAIHLQVAIQVFRYGTFNNRVKMLLTHTHTHTVTLYEIPGHTCTEMFSSCEYRKYQTKTINIETVEYVHCTVQHMGNSARTRSDFFRI